MIDCKHEDVRTVAIRLAAGQLPVTLAQWCPTCGCFAAMTATGDWSEPEFPKVAITRHFAIHRHAALCGNLFGERADDPRQADCRGCIKRLWQMVGVYVLEGVEDVLGLAVVRRLGR